MAQGGEVSAEQMDRLLTRLDGLVSSLDALILDRHTYVDGKDLQLIAKDVKNAQDDIDDMRSTLSKVVFIGLGACATFVIGLLTTIVATSQGATP